MNIFTVTPDGSLRHASSLEADALGDYTMHPAESTGDLFGQLDVAAESGSGFNSPSNTEYAYPAWLPR